MKTWDERGNGKHIHDSALAAWANAVKASSVVSASSSSLDAAVATCILHADVAAAACLLQLLLVLLLLTYDDDSCCGGDDHLSGSLLRCAQQRPLGIPMGLQASPMSPPEMCSETLNEMLYLVCEMLRLLRQSQMPPLKV